ncbi:rifin PIR protein, putative [Plasmodium reichenowi]|uniref:Rifin PIR protein, putative n=1 Tax=Plasmodium reichenowi TaxID=5854 RepID=A0A2P9D8H2_PLARE|nr:rifin PIR protein, putative [Plasmodium reichenowi]
MKLNYSKILLFFILLNILVTYQEYNKNATYIIPHHTPKYISRVLSECDIQSSNYDNNPQMKSVMQQFVDRTSQRFQEYEEHMKEKRQKRKEQRDKNIQKIIEKDKMDKSLEQKIEKGCLKCGCGLGGVAACVGIFGTVAVKELTKAAITAAAKEAVKDTALAEAAKAAGAAAGKEFFIAGLKEMGVSTLGDTELVSYFATTDYTDFTKIAHVINLEYRTDTCLFGDSGARKIFCTWVNDKSAAALNVKRGVVSHTAVVETHVKEIVTNAITRAGEVTNRTTAEAIEASTEAAKSAYASSQTAIIASVVSIIIIALVMIIIYLVLRYRRKKKMKKKAEYTKLLNQ